MPDDLPAPDDAVADAPGPADDGTSIDDPAAATAAVVDDGRGTPPYLMYGLLFVVGLIAGMFGVSLAPVRVTVGGVLLPVGLLVVVAIPVVARAAAWASGSRLGAACVAVGWALPTIAFALAGPGGDVLLPDATRTWVYLVGTTLLLVLAVAVPLPRGARDLAESRRLGKPFAQPDGPTSAAE